MKPAAWFLTMGLLLTACSTESVVDSQRDPGKPIAAETAEAEVRTVPRFAERIGTIRSLSSATISSKVVGAVISLPVREGEQVRSGQLLVEIEAGDAAAQVAMARAGGEEVSGGVEEIERSIEAAQASIRAAQANAELAALTFDRFQNLLERNSVSRQEFDEVRARNLAAQARLEEARAQVASLTARKKQLESRAKQTGADLKRAMTHLFYSRLRAPFSGQITQKHVEVGDLASPGVALLTIEDNENLRLETVVEESLLRDIRLGQRVSVGVDAVNLRVDGTVDEIAPNVDATSRTVLVKIKLPVHARLRSGMFGRALFLSEARKALFIAGSAIVHRGQLTGVYVVDAEQTAHFRLVQTGEDRDGQIEILSGLEPGERYVLDPASDIREGVRIDQQNRLNRVPDAAAEEQS